MRIQSAEVLLSSQTQINRSTDEKLLTLDANGDIISKDQTQTREHQNVSAIHHARTQTDSMVELQQGSRTQTTTEIEHLKGGFADLDDDLEKNMYMSSVLNWAADTIDDLVKAFENQALENCYQGCSDKNIRNTAPSKSFLSQRSKLYKNMAEELRTQAAQLRPPDLAPSDNRIRRTVQSSEQNTHFQASGMISTSDGNQINFTLDVGMHHQEKRSTMEMFRIIDPLVINLDGDSAELTDKKMRFDLDSDGVAESISRLDSGSRFLSLDLNQDGMINNGSELFGTKTGNGFNELALYDGDNNHWIDENDAIFHQLNLWDTDPNAEKSLLSLSEAGIGAIYLGAVDSHIQLKDAAGNAAGQVSATGIAVTEHNTIKTVQQVDLIV